MHRHIYKTDSIYVILLPYVIQPAVADFNPLAVPNVVTDFLGMASFPSVGEFSPLAVPNVVTDFLGMASFPFVPDFSPLADSNVVTVFSRNLLLLVCDRFQSTWLSFV